jgi:hypothetical protein
MHPDCVQALLNEWEKAQVSWPTALRVGEAIADQKDCQHWLRATRELLAAANPAHAHSGAIPLTPTQIEFVTTFQKRVLIHAGDLKANPFECSLSECG